MDPLQQEADRLRTGEADTVRRMREKIEEETRIADENLKREIELERTYRLNLLDIEIGKMRAELDARIEEIYKNRYNGLEADTNLEASPEYQDMLNQQRERIEREVEQERANYAREAVERRARFDKDMRVLLDMRDSKRVGFLKKAIVPLVKANGTNRVMDESVFESRHGIKITRTALRSGGAWALYKAQIKGTPALCKITVFVKMPTEYRKNIDHAVKCMRFLSETTNEYFVKLYDVFATDQKVYFFMDEVKTNHLAMLIAHKISAEDQQKWSRQICQALMFMHRYAIAHLNLKSDNIIFSNQNDIRVIGLTRAFCYFNLDQEKIIRAPVQIASPFTNHLPRECFVGDFFPQQVDVYNMGMIMHDMAVCTITTSASNVNSSKSKTKSKINSPIPNAHRFQFNKIQNASQRGLIESMVNLSFALRPLFQEISAHEYMGLNEEDK